MIIKFSQIHIPQFPVCELHFQGIPLKKGQGSKVYTDSTI